MFPYQAAWSRGATDNASDYGSEDCRFESYRDRHFLSSSQQDGEKKYFAPPGGLEPPTFRLTAERTSQLRQIVRLGLLNHSATTAAEMRASRSFTHQ